MEKFQKISGFWPCLFQHSSGKKPVFLPLGQVLNDFLRKDDKALKVH